MAVAVIGMSCRFPGANNPEEFWESLIEGNDGIRSIPPDRWYMLGGEDFIAGYLKCPLDEFDSNFFNMSPKEAPYVDPQQRIFLECAWESLEDAKIAPSSLSGSKTGVWLGIGSDEYYRNHLDTKEDNIYKAFGNTMSSSPGRFAYMLNLNGPNYSVEAACASSGVAVHLACKSLQSGECTLAIAGGVNCLLEVNTTYPSTLTSTRSKTFDESAKGFAPAEGCGVLVLKLLKEAIKDGDDILGVIRGSALNHAGKSSSFGTPNARTQCAVLRSALAAANTSPTDISFIETHGTGTPVGDPIEVEAITEAYSGVDRIEPLILSSVKTNIGHCLSAAGTAGLIKMLLCLKHKTIPRHLHLTKLNPKINLDIIPAIVPLQNIPWKGNNKGELIGAVSSFGITGAECHFIVEEPPKNISNSLNKNPLVKLSEPSSFLITISAKDGKALNTMAELYRDFIKKNETTKLSDFAYSINNTRAHHSQRVSIIVNSKPDLIDKLNSQDFNKCIVHSSQAEPIVFLFTGHGCQYFGMGKILYQSNFPFRNAFDQCDNIFKNNLQTSLRDFIWSQESDMTSTRYSQPAIFCIEYCLYKFWISLGIKPSAVLGHSIGEYAACVACGILSFDDAFRLVCARSSLAEEKLPESSMMAVGTTALHLKQLIQEFISINPSQWIDIATINSTHQTVVSSTPETIKTFKHFCSVNAPTIKTKILSSQHGFHSREMDPILDEFEGVAKEVKYNKPTCTYISGTTSKEIQEAEMNSTYWRKHLRNCVNFSDAIDLVIANGYKFYVEVGPQPVLLGFLMANNLKGVDLVACPSLRSTQDPWLTIMTSLGKLYTSWSGSIDFTHLHHGKKIRLPTYPFNRKKHWGVKPISNPQVNNSTGKLLHTLLGNPLNIPMSKEIRYYNYITTATTSWIKDHVVAGNVIFPAAAYLEMLLALSKEQRFKSGNNTFVIERLEVLRALPLSEKPIQLHTTAVKNTETDKLEVSFHSNKEDDWIHHAKAEVLNSENYNEVLTQNTLDLANVQRRCNVDYPVASVYQQLCTAGITFGDTFQSLAVVKENENQTELLAEVNLLKSDNYICHPILIDAMIQALYQLKVSKMKCFPLMLPVAINQLIVFKLSPTKFTEKMYVYLSDEESVSLYNDAGEELVRIVGLTLLETTKSALLKSLSLTEALPQFLSRDWKKLDSISSSRLPISEFSHLTKEEIDCLFVKVRNYNNEVNDLEERYGKWCVYFILQALYNIGWNPKVGDGISRYHLESLIAQYNVSFDTRAFDRMLIVLKEEGYLTTNCQKNHFIVAKQPPTQFDKLIAELHLERETELIEYKYIKKMGIALPKILKGELDPVSVLFSNDEASIVKVYSESRRCIFDIQLLSQAFENLLINNEHLLKKGKIRILEVGAGTGACTNRLIELLDQFKISYQYTFSDIGNSFVSEARKRFSDHKEVMNFEVLDIDKDPKLQGFAPHTFDIIIASSVFHACENLEIVFANVRNLLVNNGFLLFIDHVKPFYDFALSFDLIKTFWKCKDFREYCIIDGKMWEELLGKNGFIQSVNLSTPQSSRTVIVSRATNSEVHYLRSVDEEDKAWLIFSDEQDSNGLHKKLGEKMKLAGRQVYYVYHGQRFNKSNYEFNVNPKRFSDYQQLGHILKKIKIEGLLYMNTKHLPSVHTNELMKMEEDSVGGCFHLLKMNISQGWNAKIFVVTAGSEGKNPYTSTLSGLLETYLNEYPDVPAMSIDLEDITDYSTCQLFNMLWTPIAERAVVLRSSDMYVARLHPIDSSMPTEQIAIPKDCKYKIANAVDFTFEKIEHIPIHGAKVEVAIKAVGLNFRDLLLHSNLLEGQDPSSVGLEFAGVVTRIGSGSKYKIGDRVAGLAAGGALASHFMVESSDLLFPIPSNMTFVDAACTPCAFGTCYLGLITIGKLQPGEKVLIHTASGGVGLAGIQLARYLGAEVYVTAGTEKKRNYLRECIGVKHVYDSRSTNYEKQILSDTNGKGVDLVLNTITGEGFKEATLACMAKNGRFIELSKLNIWTSENVAKLRSDVQYTILDAFTLIQKLEPSMTKTIEEMGKLFGSGKLTSLAHVAFPLSQIKSAFKYFHQHQHIGKIILEIPEDSEAKGVTLFNSEVSYIITGGLGGLGYEVAKNIVSKGGNVVLVGRSSINSELSEKLTALGRNAEYLQLDIGDYESCKKLINSLKRPLKGIFHAAGIFANGFIINQSVESFSKVFMPKVYGTFNLHELTKSMNLDYFVVFSSVASVLGSTGVCNYTAANRFLDSFINYRSTELGLPGTTLNWGPWSEVGIVLKHNLITGMFKHFVHITPEAGVNSLERILQLRKQQVIIADIDKTIIEDIPKLRPLFSELNFNQSNSTKKFGAEPTNDSASQDIRLENQAKEIKSCYDNKERLKKIEHLVESCFRVHTGISDIEEVDRNQPLALMGMDSLIGMELRTRLSKLLDITIPANAIQEHNSVNLFAGYVDSLVAEQCPPPPPPEAPLPSNPNKNKSISNPDPTIQNGKTKSIPKFFARTFSKLNNSDKSSKTHKTVNKYTNGSEKLKAKLGENNNLVITSNSIKVNGYFKE